MCLDLRDLEESLLLEASDRWLLIGSRLLTSEITPSYGTIYNGRKMVGRGRLRPTPLLHLLPLVLYLPAPIVRRLGLSLLPMVVQS